MVPFRKGADGVVNHKLCFGMRFETCLVVDGFLLMAAPYRACAGSARRLRRCGGFATLLLMPQPALLCKGINILDASSYGGSAICTRRSPIWNINLQNFESAIFNRESLIQNFEDLYSKSAIGECKLLTRDASSMLIP